MKKAGFEVVEEIDLVKTADVPWYEPIDPYRVWVPWRDFWSFKTTLWGRAITHYLVWALETVGIAPKGSMASAGSSRRAPTASSRAARRASTVMYYTKAVKPK